MQRTISAKGLFFTFLAYFLWGILPIYWKLLDSIDSLHILALRILLSLILVGIILLARKNYTWLMVLKEKKKAGILVPTAIILSCNWGLYIWAVNSGHTLDASLGYYINPLVSIVLGLIFYREHLKPLQWIAVAIAFIGVTILTLLSGSLPWIPLALALTFGFYGLLKKKSPLPALESLGAETLLSVPIALVLLLFGLSGSPAHPVYTGLSGFEYLKNLPVYIWALLFLCGAFTMLPLYWFAHGAKQLPLSTLGFMQFVTPTIQFLLGLFAFGESFPPHHFAAFAIIWVAVIIYVISLSQNQRQAVITSP